jgi:uncharacterized membrane protein YhfC
MCAHVGFSLIVLKGVANKKPLYLILSMLLHTILNFAAVMMTLYGINSAYIELFVILAVSL